MQILVHSYIYYELNDNLISDNDWMRLAQELVKLQKDYPELSQKVIYAKKFKNFDGSTGSHFTYDDKIINTAKWLLKINKRK